MILNVFSYSLPAKIPWEMKPIIWRLKRARNKKECLRKARAFMKKRSRGEPFLVVKRFNHFFYKDLRFIWKQKVLHCTTMAYMLRLLLVKSGHFTDEEITHPWTLVKTGLHQYSKVKLGKKWVLVDTWKCKPAPI